MIFYEQPSAEWVPFDFKLLEAYQILQDETCPKCGHPIWLCRSDSNRVDFKVRSAVCQADKALKLYEAGQIKDRKEKSEAMKDRANMGRYFYTEPYNPPESEGGLPTRRDFYDAITAGKM